MTRYIIRRLLWGVVLLVIVVALLFVMFRVLPTADPAKLGRGACRARRSSPRSAIRTGSTNRCRLSSGCT